MSVNVFGETKDNLNSQNFLTLHRANVLFVNESGDNMKGTLDMKNNKIINVAVPTEEKDVATKKYVDELNNTYEKKYTIYNIILNVYKPKFWISAFYSHKYDPFSLYFRTPLIGSSSFSNNLEVKDGAIYFKKDDYIISEFNFGSSYTFIGIVEQITNGRVFTSLTGNKCFGYLYNYKDVVWHDSPIIYPGVTTKSDKTVYIYISSDRAKSLYKSSNLDLVNIIISQTTPWGSLVIGDTMFNEGGEFKLYECLGFDRVLNENEVKFIISNIL
jgi:hypothetical protein